MRRIAAFLLLGAGTCLVFETSLTRAADDDNSPAVEDVESAEAADDAPATEDREAASEDKGKKKKGKRGERGRRGRRGGPPGEGPRGPRGRGPGHHGPPPIIAALDADKDGVISETEIAAAVSALKTLDKNGDGQLTFDELRPEHPPHGGPPHDGPPEGVFGRRGPDGEQRLRGAGRRGRGGPDGRDRERPSPEKMIEKVMESDEDGDGKISRDEAPERLSRAFDRIDANGDGFIDRSELEEAAQRMGRGRGRRRGPRGDGEGRGKRDQRPESDDTEA